ncbi:MAG: hypothetical protein K0S46_2269 [Moraxellaceae bacterium]|jgi:hypothetical protein|nr:hypothetical protein [Moraxellaceae bacterium]
MAQRTTPTTLAIAIALASLGGNALAESITPNLQVNGFVTAGGTWISEDYGSTYLGNPYLPASGFDEKGSYQHDSVLGIQLSYAFNDKVDLVGQLVASGQNNYETEAEWAYVAYRINDNVRVRAGRFAAPFFMYTESLRVGQSYPWARPPVELYGGIPINSINGIDLLYRLPVGGWNLDAQVMLGGAENSYVKIDNSRGLNINLSNDALSLHAGYSESDVDISIAKDPFGNSSEQLAYLLNAYGVDIDTDGEDASFADVGFIYDDGAWMLSGEFGQLRIKGFASDVDAGYVTLGHYFGKWLPYVVASKVNTVKADECLSELAPAVSNAGALAGQASAAQAQADAAAATLLAQYMGTFDPVDLANYTTAAIVAAQVGQAATDAAAGQAALNGAAAITCAGKEQTTYSAGFRYDATKNVSVKLQVDHVRDFNGTPGYFAGAVPPAGDSVQVFSVNINAAF